MRGKSFVLSKYPPISKLRKVHCGHVGHVLRRLPIDRKQLWPPNFRGHFDSARYNLFARQRNLADACGGRATLAV
jgi:hypothetical protein